MACDSVYSLMSHTVTFPEGKTVPESSIHCCGIDSRCFGGTDTSSYVPIIGVLPPLIGLILLNVLIAFGVVVAVCDFSVAKWLIGWGIIGLSIGENDTVSAVYPLSCFLLLQLLFAASEAGLFEMGRRSLVIYMVVTGLVAIIAFEFGNLTRAAQAVIQDALGDYYDTYSVNGISGISDELFVASRGALTASRSPVLELSTPVERLRAKSV